MHPLLWLVTELRSWLLVGQDAVLVEGEVSSQDVEREDK